MEKIKVATVGAGFGLQAHVKYFSLPNIQHIGVLRKHAQKHEGAFATLQDLIAAKPDIVTIAVQPIEQPIIVEALLKAGIKRFFLEKPLAENYKSAHRLVNLLKQHQALAIVSFQMLELPSFQLFRSLINQHFKQEALDLNFIWLGKSRLFQDGTWNWKADKTKGGGVLPILGSHFIHLALSTFGDFSFDLVKHDNSKTLALKNANPQISAYDEVSMDMRFNDGHRGKMELSNSSSSSLIEITAAKNGNSITWRNQNKENFKGFEVEIKMHGEKLKMSSSDTDELPFALKSRFCRFLRNETEGLELALLTQKKIDLATEITST